MTDLKNLSLQCSSGMSGAQRGAALQASPTTFCTGSSRSRKQGAPTLEGCECWPPLEVCGPVTSTLQPECGHLMSALESFPGPLTTAIASPESLLPPGKHPKVLQLPSCNTDAISLHPGHSPLEELPSLPVPLRMWVRSDTLKHFAFPLHLTLYPLKIHSYCPNNMLRD